MISARMAGADHVEGGPFLDQSEDEGGRRSSGRRNERSLFFAERYFGYDDAIYAGARLLEILTSENRNWMNSWPVSLPGEYTGDTYGLPGR